MVPPPAGKNTQNHKLRCLETYHYTYGTEQKQIQQGTYGYVIGQGNRNDHLSARFDSGEILDIHQQYVEIGSKKPLQDLQDRRCQVFANCQAKALDKDWEPTGQSIPLSTGDSARVHEARQDQNGIRLRVTMASGSSQRAVIMFDNVIMCEKIPNNVGHMFRSTTKHLITQKKQLVKKEDHDYELAQGSIGVIEFQSAIADQYRVRFNHEGQYLTAIVPSLVVEIGAKYLNGKLQIVTTMPTMLPVTVPAPAAQTSFQDIDLRRFLAPVLGAIYLRRSDLTDMPDKLVALIDTPEKCRALANVFKSGLVLSSSALAMDLNNGKALTYKDFIRMLPAVQPSDNRAGVYLRFYYGFAKDSEYFGRVYMYAGKTNNFAARDNGHRKSANNPQDDSYNSLHYRVYRAAQAHGTISVVVFIVQPSPGQHRNDDADQERSFLEQLTFLLLGSYSDSVLSWDDIEAGGIRSTMAKKYDHMLWAHVLTDIAETTWNGSFTPLIRRKGFGVTHGLNKSSPISSWEVRDRIQFIQQDMGDFRAFHRTPHTMPHTMQSSGLHLVIRAIRHRFPTDDMKILGGLKVHATLEVMKGGKGPHRVPYFSAPTVSGWTNWNVLDLFGVKITFNKDGQWYVWYLQQQDLAAGLIGDSSEAGAVAPYTMAASLYARIMRTSWQNAPSFYTQSAGDIEIFNLVLDIFNQKATLSQQLGSRPTLPQPQLDLNACATRLAGHGLQNVDGIWGSRPHNLSDSERKSLPQKLVTRIENVRGVCDGCLVRGTHYQNPYANQLKNICVRQGGSNRCTACIGYGRVCSWTPIPTLLGSWAAISPDDMTPRKANMRKVFVGRPQVPLSEARRQIPDPGIEDFDLT